MPSITGCAAGVIGLLGVTWASGVPAVPGPGVAVRTTGVLVGVSVRPAGGVVGEWVEGISVTCEACVAGATSPGKTQADTRATNASIKTPKHIERQVGLRRPRFMNVSMHMDFIG